MFRFDIFPELSLIKFQLILSNSSSLNKENHDGGNWISDLNLHRFYDLISRYSPFFQFRLRRYIKHSRPCLSTFANTSKLVKNTLLCCRVLNSLLGGVWNGSQTRYFVLDIVLPTFRNQSLEIFMGQGNNIFLNHGIAN